MTDGLNYHGQELDRGCNYLFPRLRAPRVVAGSLMVVVFALTGVLLCCEVSGKQADVTLPGRFGRMFQKLHSFAPTNASVRKGLLELGKSGGLLDANDDLDAGPINLIIDPSLSLNNRNNPSHTAGTTFVGQFLDHDITFDMSSRLGKPTSPITVRNGRTPAFDLDSVYGDGPDGILPLYDPDDTIKFNVESGGLFEDLPRDQGGSAIIADPRNDEHMMIAGLHCAFMLFHNNAVDLVRSQNPSISDNKAFVEARRLTTWHYQWMILHEFLPLFVGQATVDDIRTNGRRDYTPIPGLPFIPVEFQIAYRFGHSMVRPSYRANLEGDEQQAFFGMIFDPSQQGEPNPGDLRGGVTARRRFVGWQTFFDFGDGEVKPNKRIDTKISTPLFNIPLHAIPSADPPTSLAQRNLLRHLTWQIPSGQAIARHMNMTPLAAEDLEELRSIHPSFVDSTPLWYYVLKEAEVKEDGLQLGPLGGRIVGEVFIGLLELDSNSYVKRKPDWLPTIPTETGNPQDFRMTDFLKFAGVDPVSRGQ